ncbi:MAG: NAD(P)/FAD-dependent oxidoreductase [Firmicutes bacterium]|nr:NAD(P)/FAD-dependent oxidoreductase [Bacillota bacterium]
MSRRVLVIGGGPAGMFAAVTAARQGAQVTLLEKNDRLGRKLLITGKGRCNVTNDCDAPEVLKNIPRNGKFLYSALSAFSPADTKAFFEQNGCPLKTERGRRVFPASDRSQSVLDALQRQLRASGVSLRQQARVTGILTRDGAVCGGQTSDGTFEADSVILATGGLSYPATGSTGDGYRLARELGHSIAPCEGSLVPLETAGGDAQQMQGLSLRNVSLKLLNAKGKLLYQDFGELLFTHFGISGPMALSASAHLKGEGCAVCLDLKPALEESRLDGRILRDLAAYQNRAMENALTDLLPRSMIPVILRRIGVDAAMQANSLTREQRRALVRELKSFTLPVTRKRPVEEAIITSGGVRVCEVQPATMESRLVRGLYFAGEILDCDAYTGGYNLQIAWSTAYLAGMAQKNNR